MFWGSTSRLSIDPDKHKDNSVILKGIPLDASDADVHGDVKAVDELLQPRDSTKVVNN